MTPHRLTIGLFGIGLDAYWPQFDGLEARLRGYVEQVARTLRRGDADIVDLGLIDSPEMASDAGHRFRRADVDILFLYATTYALSSTVLPVVQRARVPVIVLNLQPDAAIDYARFNAMGDRTAMTGEWLAYCGACPTPEIANVFRRAGIDFHQVTGVLNGDPVVDAEIAGWIEAAHVANVMSHNRLGLMGRYYNGMLDIASDTTAQLIAFGGHVEIVEIDELADFRRHVTDTDMRDRVALFGDEFDIDPDLRSRRSVCAPRRRP